MLYVMLLAHLLGDYLFQWGFVARWKARSLVGVLAHGVIVTITTLVCAVLVAPSWWPYALLIGLAHTVIDLVRARFLRVANPGWEPARPTGPPGRYRARSGVERRSHTVGIGCVSFRLDVRLQPENLRFSGASAPFLQLI